MDGPDDVSRRGEDPDCLPEEIRTAARWEDTLGFRREARFCATRWTLVVRVREGSETEAGEALGELCQAYWFPLYAYVRRMGCRCEEAEDLTQEFFNRYILEKHILDDARREKGKLRTFLLTVMKRFLATEWRREHAAKRGGGKEHLPLNFDEGEERYRIEGGRSASPDELYDRHWAATLLGRVLELLRLEYAGRGMEDRYEALHEALWWSSHESSYAKLAGELGMNENAVKQAVSRMRKQYRKLLKEEIRVTLDVEDEQGIREELGHLAAVLRKE